MMKEIKLCERCGEPLSVTRITRSRYCHRCPVKDKRSKMEKGNSLEEQTTQVYEKAGWTVLNGGWPDLLCFRERMDGKFDVQLVECKAGINNPVTRKVQKNMHKALKMLGLTVIVERGQITGRPWLTVN